MYEYFEYFGEDLNTFINKTKQKPGLFME